MGWVSFIVGNIDGVPGTGGIKYIIWIGKEKGLCISIMKSL